jgi:hypothetical protein
MSFASPCLFHVCCVLEVVHKLTATCISPRRTAVDVMVEFLNDAAYHELFSKIAGSETQPVRYHSDKDGRKRICKTFRVYNGTLFVLALRFKAALNHASWLAEHGSVGALPANLFGE